MTARKARTKAKPRADSIRNRERLLVAAASVFGANAAQASLEAVAREAGLGIGTLYRHFPSREDLFEAVYRHEIDQLFALAEKLSTAKDPVASLRKWLHANVRLAATKKGMIEALQLSAYGSSELKTYSFDRLTSAIALLLDRGVALGALREDVTPEEVFRALVGTLYSQGGDNWQTGAIRLVDIFVDGLRSRSTKVRAAGSIHRR